MHFPINKTMYMRPADVPPSAWFGHVPFAGWLTEVSSPSLLVELGTHYGTSFLAFCQAIAENSSSCRAFAVDTWEGDEHAGVYGDEVFESLSAVQSSKYGSFSTLLRMKFDEALNLFEDRSVDILHIDGLHTYEAVSHDFQSWLPKLSDSSVVLFHDTSERTRDFGVWRFWSEVSKEYPSFTFGHGHGLGVLGVGKSVPEDVKRLFDLDAADASLIRHLFERAASHLEITSEVDRLARALIHERALRRTEREGAVAALMDPVRRDLVCVKTELEAMVGEKSTELLAAIRSESAGTEAVIDRAEHAWEAFATGVGSELRRDIGNIASEIREKSALLDSASDRLNEGIHRVEAEVVKSSNAVAEAFQAETDQMDQMKRQLGESLSQGLARVSRDLVAAHERVERAAIEIRAEVQALRTDKWYRNIFRWRAFLFK